MNQRNETMATEVIRQEKAEARKWFAAWLVTFAALIISNTAWMRRKR